MNNGKLPYKIEKGWLLPDAWPGFVRTLRALEIGDSFHIEDPGLATPSTIYSLARREGIRVAVRQMDGGIRIWRVEDQQHLDTASVPRIKKNLRARMGVIMRPLSPAPSNGLKAA